MKERKHQNLSSGAFFPPMVKQKRRYYKILRDITRKYKTAIFEAI